MANANNNNAQQQIVAAAPPLTPLRYPSKDFDCFERWIRHFEAMAQANNWDDARQRAVLPTCLNNYALDEYNNIPNQYLVQVQGQPAPTIERLLNALNNRIGDFLMQEVHEPRSRTSSKIKGRALKNSLEEFKNWAKQQTLTWTQQEGRKPIRTRSSMDWWTEKYDTPSSRKTQKLSMHPPKEP